MSGVSGNHKSEYLWYLNICLHLPVLLRSVLFNSATQSCLTLCDPVDCCMPGFPVHHQFPEFTQMHVPEVGDATQPSHPPSSPSPSTFNLSQIRFFFFSNESILRIRWPKYWSFSFSISLPMNIQDWFPLGLTGWVSLQSKGLSRVFSNTTIQKHQFFGAQLSL